MNNTLFIKSLTGLFAEDEELTLQNGQGFIFCNKPEDDELRVGFYHSFGYSFERLIEKIQDSHHYKTANQVFKLDTAFNYYQTDGKIGIIISTIDRTGLPLDKSLTVLLYRVAIDIISEVSNEIRNEGF